MIVYHLCRAQDISQHLAEGLRRRHGRHYVFQRWENLQLLLSGLTSASPDEDPSTAYAVLVLDVDEDMLVPGPIPQRRVPPGLCTRDLHRLQAHSYFLEMDLSPKRIQDVKDGLGNSIIRRYKQKEKGGAPIWRFLAYIKPYWPYAALATTAGLIKFLTPLAFPWILQIMLDEVVLKEGIEPGVREHRILELILLSLAANGIWMVACYCRSVLAAIAGHRMIRDLRVALFDHVQCLSHAFFARHQTGAIVSRMIIDLSLAQNFVGSALTNVWMDGALLLTLVAILLAIHPMLTLISLLLMPLYVFSLRSIGARIRLNSKEVQQRLEILSGSLQEKVAGVAIVKGFTSEPYEVQSFATQANKLLNKILYSVRFTATNEVLVGLVVHSSPVLVAWYGARQILARELTVGELTQFLLYLAMFYSPLQRLSDLSVVLANSLSAIERIFEYFDTQPHVAERPNAKRIARCQGHIEFERVHFSYDPGTPVLHDISLTILPGETVAFVGPSGSGKSTLANLVPRFYDPTAGAIRLDGCDLKDLELASLRRQIGIVNQETLLFSGTIEENLLLAKPNAKADEILAALEAANALEFVERLPEGLWTEIGERGIMLSGGQKQRLAIARAFLKNPKILILDEATSALDSRSERHIQEALTRLLKGRTSIVIAHRLSTILNADRIAVIDAGRLVETGSNTELLARGGLYAQLYNEQFHPVKGSSPVGKVLQLSR